MVESEEASTRVRLLEQARDRLDPASALDVIDETAGRLVSAIAIVSSLVGIFAVVSTSALADVGTGWALPCVAAAGMSMLLAVLASLPAKDTIAIGDLKEVERWFGLQLEQRSRLLRWAVMALAAALLLSLLPGFIAASSKGDGDLHLSLDRTDDQARASISVADGPENAVVSYTLRSGPITLAAGELELGKSGTREITVPSPPDSTLRLQAELTDGQDVSERELTALEGLKP